MRRRGLYASHVSYICIELHDGASMALWLAIAASPTAQISSPCGRCQLCRPGTLSSSCQALLPLSYMGVLRVGCRVFFCLRSSALYGSYFASCFVEHTWHFAWPAVIAVLHHTLLPVAIVSFASQVGLLVTPLSNGHQPGISMVGTLSVLAHSLEHMMTKSEHCSKTCLSISF